MKRIMILTILSLFSLSAQASLKKAYKFFKSNKENKYERMTYYLINSKYYFAALNTAKEHLKRTDKITTKFSKALEVILMKTGKEGFMDLETSVLSKFDDPTINFLLGIKYFNAKRFEQSKSWLEKIGEDNKNIVESTFMLGVINSQFNRDLDAQKYYQQCFIKSNKASKQVKNDKLKRYYVMIAEKCLIHSARLYYRAEEYQKAIEQYQEIPKTSYNWPFILLEKSWAYYKIKDYNRTLGLLTTYKSPLLTSYFYPESEVLMALTYFRLCLWKDSNNVINNYYKVYKKRSNELKSILSKNKRSNDFFFDLLVNPGKKAYENTFFMRNMKTKIRKTVKYSIDLNSYNQSFKEFERIKKLPKNKFTRAMRQWVYEEYTLIKYKMNHYIKKNMFLTINEIYRYSSEMFNIKLEISSKMRSLLYKNQKLISSRSRGSHENVKRDQFQYFWDFSGGFWADELGDYSFGLKSNCEQVKVKRSKKS